MLTGPLQTHVAPPRPQAASAAPDPDAASFAQALTDARDAREAPHAPEPPRANAAPRKPQAPGARPDAAARPPKAEGEKSESVASQEEAAPAGEPRKDTHAADGLATLLPGWTPPPDTKPEAAVAADTTAALADPSRAAHKPAARDARQADAGQDIGAAPPAALVAAGKDALDTSRLQAADPRETPALPREPAPAAPTAPSLLGQPAALNAPQASDTPAAPFQAQLAAALHSAEFAPALGAQVSVLARDGIQEAQLHLNPPDMGPIAVQIDVVEARVSVEFSADHAATRAVLEQGLPELAAALRESGLTLSGGGVFQQPRERDRGDASADPRAPRRRGGGDGKDAPVAGGATPRAPLRRGVVDLYA